MAVGQESICVAAAAGHMAKPNGTAAVSTIAATITVRRPTPTRRLEPNIRRTRAAAATSALRRVVIEWQPEPCAR